jgi:cell division protein FtsB
MHNSPHTSRRHPSSYSSAELATSLQVQRVQTKRRLRALRQKADELAAEITLLEDQLTDIDRAERNL